MNTILKKSLSSILAFTLLSTTAIYTSYANTLTVFAAEPTALKSENISFEYITTVYNGQARKPKITVTSNGAALTENVDFTVSYPNDCINAGVKTVSISGKGNYAGSFSATYKIEPLDVSKSSVEFSATAEPCYYNGFGQVPDFTVKANGITIPNDSYTTAFSNNINASKNAACEFTFGGNFTGKRTAEFTISKTERDNIDVEIYAKPGERITYDLTSLLPEGASFGTPKYFYLDFPDDGRPVIAFNELSFTCGKLDSDTSISVPVTGAKNFGDFYVNVYLTKSDKIIPKLVIKPIVREYNGKEVDPGELPAAGCYAEVNGTKIEGKWTFWRPVSGEPHTAVPCVFLFEPSDERYVSVDGIVFVTTNKLTAKDFSAQLNNNQVALGKMPILTVSGVPEERKDRLRIECSAPEDFSYTEYHSPYLQEETELRYRLSFPYISGVYTVTALLPEDSFHAAAKASCTITVGDYVPPEEQIPDKVTTAEELSAMISAAPTNGFITAEGMRSISKELITAAAAKRLTLEVKLNDTYTWVFKTEKLNSSLNLNLGSAAIPSVLTEKIGGTTACAFTVNEKNLGSDAELRVTLKNTSDRYASLFYYNTNGTLDFVSCARIEADKTVDLPLQNSGKYIVITDNETKLPGDSDNNNVLTLSDIGDFLRMYINSKFSDLEWKFDINHDGFIRIDDISALLNQYINKK